jgi:hypothetical protein
MPWKYHTQHLVLPKKKKQCKKKHNSQEDETKLLVPNAQYHKFRLTIIQIEKLFHAIPKTKKNEQFKLTKW